ncbi:hypothetical protein Bbelb_358580 [Branchiostoma belcheri]|nr:hypothetical protein Bbelb_358580 [Branchiostoma belcheri]
MCALSDAQFFTKLPSTTPIQTTLPKLPTTTLDATTPWGSTTPREDTTPQGETTPQLQEETTQGVSTTPEESTTILQEETTPRRVTAGSSTPDAATITVTASPGTESTTSYSSSSVQGLQTWEIALIAVGASLGGILVIGGVGYGIYKACGKPLELVLSMRWSHMKNRDRAAPDISCPSQLHELRVLTDGHDTLNRTQTWRLYHVIGRKKPWSR